MNTIEDSVKLSLNIQNCLSPYDKYTIVNIQRNPSSVSRVTFWPGIKEIGAVYTYSIDKTPQFLKEEGVILNMNECRWFTNSTNVALLGAGDNDALTIAARNVGYISKKEYVAYFRDYKSRNHPWGPTEAGQYAVLIDVMKLKSFIGWYSNLVPKFNTSTGEFSFLGEKMTISGSLKIKSFDLLIKNINSLVSKEDFYEVRGGQYKICVKGVGKEQTNNAPEQMFKVIKTEIRKHPIFGKVLVFVQDNGYGVFIDQHYLQRNTQNIK